MNGKRLLFFSALLALIATGCNLSDDEAAAVLNNQVEQNNTTNNATNTASNNSTNTATNNATNNGTNNTTNNGTTNLDAATVVFDEKRINNVVTDAGQAVASSAFEVSATLHSVSKLPNSGNFRG